MGDPAAAYKAWARNLGACVVPETYLSWTSPSRCSSGVYLLQQTAEPGRYGRSSSRWGVMDWLAIRQRCSAFGGGGGVVALYRARSQNRVDERRQLTDEADRVPARDEQRSWRRSDPGGRTWAAGTTMLEDDAKTGEPDSGELKTTNEYQARQLTLQQEQITQLQRANAALEAQLAELVEEKAKVVQQLQVAIAEEGLSGAGERAVSPGRINRLRLRLSGGAEGGPMPGLSNGALAALVLAPSLLRGRSRCSRGLRRGTRRGDGAGRAPSRASGGGMHGLVADVSGGEPGSTSTGSGRVGWSGAG